MNKGKKKSASASGNKSGGTVSGGKTLLDFWAQNYHNSRAKEVKAYLNEVNNNNNNNGPNSAHTTQRHKNRQDDDDDKNSNNNNFGKNKRSYSSPELSSTDNPSGNNKRKRVDSTNESDKIGSIISLSDDDEVSNPLEGERQQQQQQQQQKQKQQFDITEHKLNKSNNNDNNIGTSKQQHLLSSGARWGQPKLANKDTLPDNISNDTRYDWRSRDDIQSTSNDQFMPNGISTSNNNNNNNNNMNNSFIRRTGSDTWDSVHVKLPCSPMNTYRAKTQTTPKSKWYLIQTFLKQKINTAYELQELIITLRNSGDNSMASMDMTLFIDFFQSYMKKEDYDQFFNETLPWMQNIAIKLPDLFPEPIKLLKKQKESSVKLTCEQIACLMTHAFFCTFPRRDKTTRKDHEYYTYPNINFTELYKETRSIKTEKMMAEKLKTIIHYFTKVSKDPNPKRIVEFHRRVLDQYKFKANDTTDSYQEGDSEKEDEDPLLEMWQNSDQRLINCDVRLNGTIEDESSTSQVDFANKAIGGGVIGRGCVQEEIRFLINTECIISRLFTEEFEHNECMIIRGARRFAKYTGYAETFCFDGDYDGPASVKEEIVCVDALNFADRFMFSSSTDQYKSEWIIRELNKIYCAFKTLSYDKYNHDMKIATGHWGGGAFGGDRELKALIQLMAASQTQRSGVIYFAYGDEEFVKNFDPLYSLLINIRATVSEMFSCIMDYRTKRVQIRQRQRKFGLTEPIPSVLTHVFDWFASEESNPSLEDVVDQKVVVDESTQPCEIIDNLVPDEQTDLHINDSTTITIASDVTNTSMTIADDLLPEEEQLLLQLD